MSLFARLGYWLDDLGTYWVTLPPGSGDKGYWAERWWAPSRIARQKWCFIGIHAWCLMGDGGSHDYWYVGFFTRPGDHYRFCAYCSVRAGAVRHPRPASRNLGHCPDCGITDRFLGEYGHFSGCRHRLPA